MWTILRYQYPLTYQYPLAIPETLQNYYLGKLINFQDATNKSDFDTYYTRKFYDLAEKSIFGCYYYFLVRYWLPQQFLKNFRGTKLVQLINVQDPICKSDFDICQLILSIPEKLAGNQYYVWRILEYQFPLRYQLPQQFMKNLRGIEYV